MGAINMNNFQLHDLDTASSEAKSLLEESLKGFGMIPNLHAVMAESPALLEGYKTLHELAQKSSLNAEQLTVVWQTKNVEHACHYCVPAHTAIANMMKIDNDITEALRNQTPLKSEKLEILRDTTLAILRQRGIVADIELAKFYAAGFSRQNLLDIVLVLSQKVMSNYVNYLAETPVDEAFQPFVWTK
ncbi:MAG: alkylhydroperoxidase family enzyme [Paraglaciecola sp.]|jgi:alkylhydroperoxidase family enzyme